MLCLQVNKRSKDIDLVLLFQYKQHNQSQMFFNKEIVLTGLLKLLSLKFSVIYNLTYSKGF